MNDRTTYRPTDALVTPRDWMRRALERPLGMASAAAIVVSLIALLGWSVGRSAIDPAALDPSAKGPVLELLPQEVATVEVRSLSRRVPLTGTLQPRDWSEIKAQVAGEIEEVSVRAGEQVKRDQVLARFDARELRARLADKQASLAGAKAQLELARKKLDSMRAMRERELVSTMELDTAESTYRVNRASVDSLQAQLDQAKKALEDCEIRSPLDGVVAERAAQVGSAVTPGSKLFTVMDLSMLELTALVPASDIPSVQLGQEVTFQVEGFGARSFTGMVERINPSTEPGSRSIALYVQIANPAGELKGGMFAQGTLRIAETVDAKVIPASAVHREADASFVYRIDGDTVSRRTVDVGIRDVASGSVAILSGLEAGDRVIVSALENLQPGTAVRITALDSVKP